jgi:multiple antibiotic resistance protein
MRSIPSAAFALLAFSSLLAIVNPLSAVPMFLAITAPYTAARRGATLRRAILTAILTLVAFALLGTFILTFFGITANAFRITGGILFLGIGSDMLQAKRSREKSNAEEDLESTVRDDVAIIPLGIPTLAGPGAITTVITLEAQAQRVTDHVAVYGAIVIVMLIAWVALAVAPALFRRLGQTGLNVMTRLMGLLVMVVGTQFIIDGLRAVATEFVAAR